jgi:hypothetical protein
MSRYKEAKAYYNQALERVKTTPEPKLQKFPVGVKVKIAKDLGKFMSHFKSDVEAIVEHTYAHAYGGNDVYSYSLIINGSSTAWYYENQLTLIK